MEIKDDEFQTLRLRVEQISSELDKQNTVRTVNTKWMVIVGSLILAALGFTSFIQVPREAAKSAKEAIGTEIIEKAKDTLRNIEADKEQANEILSGMQNFNQFADKNGYAWVGSIKFVWGTRDSTKDKDERFPFKLGGKSEEFNFKNECFTVVTSLAANSGSPQCKKDSFTLNRVDGYEGKIGFNFVAIGR